MADANGIGERGQRILEELFRCGTVSVHHLCQLLDTSPATMRRDLAMLERQGRLRRTHGGATPVEPLLYEHFRHDSTFQEQIERRADEKRRIASAAAELVRDGETVALTAGTTTMLVTRSLPQRKDVTVVINTVNVAMELCKRPDLKILVTGGYMHGGWFSLVGPPGVHVMSSVFVDKVFIGVNGIDAERGLTAYHPDEAAFNRTMIAQAKEKIVVADHSKLGVVTTHLMCPTEEVDILITDSGASPEAVALFVAKGIDVRLV